MLDVRTIKVNWQRAVTEFVVIVFGVLAALAVDEWRSARQDRITEYEYLARIRTDIQADIDNFRRLEEIFQSKADTITELKELPKSDLFARDPSKLMEGLNHSSYVALPDSRSTTFDELMSTGRLALIRDVEQRDALSRYYSEFEHISAILFEPVGDYRRLLFETFQPELLERSRLTGNVVKLSEIQSDLESLISHPDFLPAANTEIVYANSLLYYLQLYRKQAEQVLDLLSVEHPDEL